MIHTVLIAILFLLTSCIPVYAQDEPTVTPVPPSPAAALPTAARSFQPIPTPSEQPSTPAEQCVSNQHTQYIVSAHMDYSTYTLNVQQSVLYTNLSDLPQGELHFFVEPTRWLNAFTLNTILLNSTDLAYTLDEQRLIVVLPQLVQPGCTVQIALDFFLRVPPLSGGANAYKGYFSHTPTQVNLGYWLPMLGAFINGRWIVHNVSAIGEQAALPVSNWDVTLTIANAPESLTIAAPGTLSQLRDDQWRFRASGLRDFTLSLSASFEQHTEQTTQGFQVELYTIQGTSAAAVDHALEQAVRAAEMFSDLFGVYPFERLIVVQGEFPDGMEFSGLVYVSSDWFTRYEGSPASYLTLITVHEVAHQWWYAQVGSDAAIHPWLDEALATYCEYIFLEEYYPDLTDWWWEFRVNRLEPQGYVDSTVYEFTTIREYINAVYLRGVQMLHALRTDLGTEAFFDWLRTYAAEANGGLASPEQFFSLLSAEQYEQTAQTRRLYLRNRGE